MGLPGLTRLPAALAAVALAFAGIALGMQTASASCTSSCEAMSWHNGPVQHAENVRLVFWTPNAHPVPSTYRLGLGNFLSELARTDYTTKSPLSVMQQYYDGTGTQTRSGFVPNAVENKGSFVDTRAYPTSTCTDSVNTTALPVCLTDAQIRNELKRYIQAKGLPTGLGQTYLLITPQGVGDCATDTACAYQQYCQYTQHASGPLVYGVVPWAYQEADCDPNLAFSSGYPNGDAIDTVVASIEAAIANVATDPLSTGWADTSNYRIADKCGYDYGAGYGTVAGLPNNGSGYWNVRLGNDVYLLFTLYDQRTSNCALTDTDTQPVVSVAVTPSTPTKGAAATFKVTVTDPAKPVYAHWTFGDGGSADGVKVTHTYKSTGKKTIVVIVTDSHGNEKRVSKTVKVTS